VPVRVHLHQEPPTSAAEPEKREPASVSKKKAAAKGATKELVHPEINVVPAHARIRQDAPTGAAESEVWETPSASKKKKKKKAVKGAPKSSTTGHSYHGRCCMLRDSSHPVDSITSIFACVLCTEPPAFSGAGPKQRSSETTSGGGGKAAPKSVFGTSRPSSLILNDSINAALPECTAAPSPLRKSPAAQARGNAWGDGYDYGKYVTSFISFQ